MKDTEYLYDRLIRLGDLMGDGCHLEPDGKWIEKEYRDIVRLLGLSSKKSVHRDTISRHRCSGKGERKLNRENR